MSFSKKIITIITGAILCTSLVAEEESRGLNQTERFERLREIEENHELSAALGFEGEELEEVDNQNETASVDSDGEEVSERASPPRTDHNRAWHWVIAVAYNGSWITLEDGSVWSVNPSDAYKVLSWYVSDVLYVTTNSSGSLYDFKIVNYSSRDHKESVRCNFSLSPYEFGEFSFWIDHVDTKKKRICLQDGSWWDVSWWDDKEISKWKKYDLIVIGINKGSLSTWNPNFLINWDRNSYVRVSRL